MISAAVIAVPIRIRHFAVMCTVYGSRNAADRVHSPTSTLRALGQEVAAAVSTACTAGFAGHVDEVAGKR